MSSIMQSFFLAMILHPDVQKEAQQSIDRICHGRLPDFSDSVSLPYIHAVLKELLRWHPVVSLSKRIQSIEPSMTNRGPVDLAHVSTQDDVYNGYYIPKGSVVLANIWYAYCSPDHHAISNCHAGPSYTIQMCTRSPSCSNPVDFSA